MPGFSNGVMYANNVDFTGNSNPLPQMTLNGQLIIGRTGLNPTIGTLSSGTGINVVNGAGTITVNSVGGGLTWTTVGAGAALNINTGIICTGGAALSFSLPAVSSVGDLIEITLDGSTSWSVTQAANQQIRVSNTQTTLGVGGSLTSTNQGDSIRMVCSVANLRWNVLSVVGNLNLV